MRYSKQFKLKCVELYKQGKYPKTPDNISTKRFHKTVREWVLMYENCGSEVFEVKARHEIWTPEQKLILIQKVLNGQSIRSVAFRNGISPGQLYTWLRNYRLYGYDGLTKKPGRKPKESVVERKIQPTELTESEREELIRLREETARMKTEIAAIKKEIALREKQEKARLKAKKQRLSKNSEKPGTN